MSLEGYCNLAQHQGLGLLERSYELEFKPQNFRVPLSRLGARDFKRAQTFWKKAISDDPGELVLNDQADPMDVVLHKNSDSTEGRLAFHVSSNAAYPRALEQLRELLTRESAARTVIKLSKPLRKRPQDGLHL